MTIRKQQQQTFNPSSPAAGPGVLTSTEVDKVRICCVHQGQAVP